MICQKSGPWSWSANDTQKVLRAFCWSLGSAFLAGSVAVWVLPIGPLLWILPLIPVFNSLLYGFHLWVADNRYK